MTTTTPEYRAEQIGKLKAAIETINRFVVDNTDTIQEFRDELGGGFVLTYSTKLGDPVESLRPTPEYLQKVAEKGLPNASVTSCSEPKITLVTARWGEQQREALAFEQLQNILGNEQSVLIEKLMRGNKSNVRN